jgi:hypothetical protein
MANHDERRTAERYELKLDLPVVDAEHNCKIGYLADITNDGLMIAADKALHLQHEYFLEIVLEKLNANLFYNDGQQDKRICFCAFSLWQIEDASGYKVGFRMLDVTPAANMAISYLIRKFRKRD